MKTKKTSMQDLLKNSYLSGGCAPYTEAMYDRYLESPTHVDQQWRAYFDSLQKDEASPDISHHELRETLAGLVRQPARLASAQPADHQAAVDRLIQSYRHYGHIAALVNPLATAALDEPRLTYSYHALSDADATTSFDSNGLLGESQSSLRDITAALKRCYCSTTAIEYMHVSNEQEYRWLQTEYERRMQTHQFDVESKQRILSKLIASEGLEKYLDTKYPGQKRFSIEGAESLIPMLDHVCGRAAASGVEEVVIGMAHRGRLNVLLNIMGQSAEELFNEFDGKKDYGMTSGDVKYHRGYSSDIETAFGPLHLSLAFNPSHLEFISAIVLGSARARQDKCAATPVVNGALPILIHGDAAFVGQGVVQETLSMSQTNAYCVGGSIHIVINNQVGFTTSNPKDARSSRYCSDPAKMIEAPVIHVNGDDPEAAVAAIDFALAYRQTFHKDIVIDLVCYRRHGHQEVDEPRATQPLMYQQIRQHPTTMTTYSRLLTSLQHVTESQVSTWVDEYRAKLDAGDRVVEIKQDSQQRGHAANWAPYLHQTWDAAADIAVPIARLQALGRSIATLPEGFKTQRNVGMIMAARAKMAAGEQPVDWGFAENLAYASLLTEGHVVRLTGEDVNRGTFFHRHATLHDEITGQTHQPLNGLSEDQAPTQIFDSLLSETGALGFEYGYASHDPDALVIWEAQFGDFANGAQVIIDQFISSGWQKWQRLSGLVMLLPHGQEGMGPEHSSARLERFLQLCAQDNIQVIVPSTPAQIFHFLRRQVLRSYRKPLVVMSPKRLLRHKLAVSSLEDLASGELQLVIPEQDAIDPSRVTQVVACSGKVYYELLEQRRALGIEDIALIRIEQLYPFPYALFESILSSYTQAKTLVWCQEEPKNQGAWFCTRDRLLKCLPEGWALEYVGRAPMAAPACGYPALHQQQQTALINQALRQEEK